MKKFTWVIFLILFPFAGCTQQLNLVDSMGSPMPNPVYYGSSTTKPFYATWYLYSTTVTVDRDNSQHLTPTYLSMMQNHTFNKNKIKKVVLGIHVTNEQARYYELVENYKYTVTFTYKIGDDKRVDPMWRNTTYIGKETKTKKKVVGKSDMKYRVFLIELPLEDILTCNYELDVLDGSGELIFKIGNIDYSVTSY